VDRFLQEPQPIDDLARRFGAVAMPRILDLLKKHQISGTFYIPGHTALIPTS
jgi:hypothetical protein